MDDGYTVAVVGDLLIASPAMPYHETQELAAILKRADVVAGNLENIIHDTRTYKLPIVNNGVLAGMTSEPGVAKDLRAMGITMVGRANNIVSGYGIEGMRETSQWLDEAGIVHAGVGETLGQARAARYLSTAKGRTAIVSFATTFESHGMAQDPNGLVPGLPGLSPLRMNREVVVTSTQMQVLRDLREALPDKAQQRYDAMTASQTSTPVAGAADKLQLFGTWYKPGSSPGYTFEPNRLDEHQILQGIRNGKANADFLITSVHSHEGDIQAIKDMAHKAIDAGADLWLGTGNHVLRGIEIYKGRPIFYSLGDFFFQVNPIGEPVSRAMYDARLIDPNLATDAEYQNQVWPRQPAGLYQSIIAVSKFEKNQLSEVRLYPIDLGQDRRMSSRGRPRLADKTTGDHILNSLKELSAPYGTVIKIEGNVGVIRVAPTGKR
ncbi:CapA family protein [Sphingobium xenophagum]|uniref:CapA family protein n=1 Tax=Sphingobium xenophagum TaxID=121428 RepID=UPI0012FC0D85|nr:CapA family protein [Sphingobium xenophagum]